MIRQEEVYKIGKIGKPHGVKGEVSFMFDDDVFDRVDSEYLVLLIDGILVPFFFEEYRFKTNETALMKFSDIDTKEQAQELTGCEVYFPRKLSDRDESEISWNETEGFKLVDENSNGKLIGTITSVDDSTMNLLFNVITPDGEEILIPASEDFITNIDVEKREISVNLPEGLLDLHK
ncbi:MAG: ribosome maturation factor RimM [Prevotellaceae bacterium]|nr:ribosome maturation factor RimM [Prevotellaceae bacterium]